MRVLKNPFFELCLGPNLTGDSLDTRNLKYWSVSLCKIKNYILIQNFIMMVFACSQLFPKNEIKTAQKKILVNVCLVIAYFLFWNCIKNVKKITFLYLKIFLKNQIIFFCVFMQFYKKRMVKIPPSFFFKSRHFKPTLFYGILKEPVHFTRHLFYFTPSSK